MSQVAGIVAPEPLQGGQEILDPVAQERQLIAARAHCQGRLGDLVGVRLETGVGQAPLVGSGAHGAPPSPGAPAAVVSGTAPGAATVTGAAKVLLAALAWFLTAWR